MHKFSIICENIQFLFLKFLSLVIILFLRKKNLIFLWLYRLSECAVCVYVHNVGLHENLCNFVYKCISYGQRRMSPLFHFREVVY